MSNLLFGMSVIIFVYIPGIRLGLKCNEELKKIGKNHGCYPDGFWVTNGTFIIDPSFKRLIKENSEVKDEMKRILKNYRKKTFYLTFGRFIGIFIITISIQHFFF
ncbi:hypothetical protein PVA45_05910 [Entomospira entomophila]|uniref:Uncharacterized protein n=1 Tax=Entomospira entomophila TaxID=2719988 RepID=A0A968GAP2_9SPIO|nr:hypothetical protein [Entomospira entomophilus]NIZ41032.1 hypothetical protein [Entomospira entomophilus]WDI35245.1 hypothetical protein PVA45_05910 [Entomospira entomophilus]